MITSADTVVKVKCTDGNNIGFAWTPHGTYARDLEHFVKLLDFTPMESIVAATAGVAKLFMREDELGKVLPGYLADLILVNGDPLEDISVLQVSPAPIGNLGLFTNLPIQHHDKLDLIIINGRIHKASYKEFAMTKDLPSILQPAIDRMQNFVAYALEDGTNRTRIGHLDFEKDTITPLSFVSGTPVETLYQILEVGHDQVIASGPPFDYKERLVIMASKDVCNLCWLILCAVACASCRHSQLVMSWL